MFVLVIYLSLAFSALCIYIILLAYFTYLLCFLTDFKPVTSSLTLVRFFVDTQSFGRPYLLVEIFTDPWTLASGHR